MVDFTNLPRRNKTYAGANGSKIAVMYNWEQYMLKFPVPPSRNKEMSYTNGCVSEYLGSHIFALVGIPVQETLLGTYSKNGREKIVVACKDFTSPGVVIQDFASLKNTIIDSEHNGYGTELSDILNAIREQQVMDPVELEGCNEALRRIVPRIHMEQIEKLVNETPFITDLQKQFYKTMLWERKTRILDYSLQLL